MSAVAAPPAVRVRRLERVAETDAHEGPVYVAGEHALYFTTARPCVAIRRLDLSTGAVDTVRADSNTANGMTLDHAGRLIICEQGTQWRPAAITRMGRDAGAAVETLADNWLGLPLNSPNDVVVKRDGTIWFTDPSYGHIQGFRPPPRTGDHVYRLDPRTGWLTVVADVLDKPNGLAFAPAEDVLYVGDSGAPHQVWAFEVVRGRRLASARVLAVIEPGEPDGIKTDAAGRVYVSCADGAQILSPRGARVGEIALPGAVNFTWGPPGVLYVTADDAIWAATLTTL